MKKINIRIAAILTAVSLLACSCSMGQTQQSGEASQIQEQTPIAEQSSEPSVIPESSEEQSQIPEPTVQFTIEAGDTVEDIAQQLEENGICTAEDFKEVCAKVPDSPLFAEYEPSDIRPYPIEGYILAGDYELFCEKDAQEIVGCIMEQTEQIITEEMRQKAGQMGYTVDEIVTLSSIVQKESKTVDAMNGVAAVFLSRLASPDYSRLQSDMTKKYNGGTHNTYEVKGLPAGPICNVSIEAIEATLNPLDIEAYYFVYDTERNYYYAKTYKEHKDNIKKLQDEGIFDIW